MQKTVPTNSDYQYWLFILNVSRVSTSLPPESRLRCLVTTTDPVLNRRSTAALDRMHVLYRINRFMIWGCFSSVESSLLLSFRNSRCFYAREMCEMEEIIIIWCWRQQPPGCITAICRHDNVLRFSSWWSMQLRSSGSLLVSDHSLWWSANYSTEVFLCFINFMYVDECTKAVAVIIMKHRLTSGISNTPRTPLVFISPVTGDVLYAS